MTINNNYMAAPKGNNFNPKGRPPKPINWEQFESLCEIQCIQEEIAHFFKIHPETLSHRVVEEYGEDYSTVYKRYAAPGKCSLRRAQFKLAMKNPSMAIWLGKIWLGQRDISKEEMQDIAKEIIDAVRESEASPRANEVERPALEVKSPLLDQGCPRQTDQVSNELGTEGAL